LANKAKGEWHLLKEYSPQTATLYQGN